MDRGPLLHFFAFPHQPRPLCNKGTLLLNAGICPRICLSLQRRAAIASFAIETSVMPCSRGGDRDKHFLPGFSRCSGLNAHMPCDDSHSGGGCKLQEETGGGRGERYKRIWHSLHPRRLRLRIREVGKFRGGEDMRVAGQLCRQPQDFSGSQEGAGRP